jgi:hypothetical protein
MLTAYRMLAAMALAGAMAAPQAQAKIVARDILIHMDQADPSHHEDVGKVHEARIFYDDAQIDPVTHRVPILHQQHTPMHIPFHPDAAEMPVGNAWLDLSHKPYTYHMAASPAVRLKPDGTPMWSPYAILFDEQSHRMTIRRQSDGGLELSGPYVVGDEVLSGPDIDWVINGKGPPAPVGALPEMKGPPAMPPKGPPLPPLVARKGGHLVALKVTIAIDQIAPEDESMYKPGQIDIARIVYDSSQVDPVTHTVPLLEEAHLIAGHYHPNRITGASQLMLGEQPYRLTYASSVNHGRDLVVLFEGAGRRMAMLARPDFHMLIAGHYEIDPRPVAYDPAHPDN